MTAFSKKITVIDTQNLDYTDYGRHFTGALVATHDGQLLLQKRGDNWDRFPGMLATFGGQLDSGETPEQGLIRELNEELGAKVNISNAVFLGAVTKSDLKNALIHGYFWHDQEATITGCYEGEFAFFSRISDILRQPNVTSDARWIVNECVSKGLLLNC